MVKITENYVEESILKRLKHRALLRVPLIRKAKLKEHPKILDALT